MMIEWEKLQSCKGTEAQRNKVLTGPSATLFLTCLGIVLLLLSCGKNPEADATAELAASFENSPAKEDVIKANAAFEEGRYKESLQLLHKVAGRGDLTERQKKAMAGIVGQLLKAVHEDPELSKDTQLHRLMELLVLRTMGET
ncbi:MAG: hypothetical protein ACYSWW_16150 [Planctomycetota bacterium]|jgi:hypothetical protein